MDATALRVARDLLATELALYVGIGTFEPRGRAALVEAGVARGAVDTVTQLHGESARAPAYIHVRLSAATPGRH